MSGGGLGDAVAAQEGEMALGDRTGGDAEGGSPGSPLRVFWLRRGSESRPDGRGLPHGWLGRTSSRTSTASPTGTDWKPETPGFVRGRSPSSLSPITTTGTFSTRHSRNFASPAGHGEYPPWRVSSGLPVSSPT